MAVNEGLSLGGLELNAEGLSAASLELPPARRKMQLVGTADSDGELLVGPSHFENVEATVRVRIEPQASMDDALDLIQRIDTKIAAAEDYEGDLLTPAGLPLVWSPAGSTHSGTIYVVSGEITERPIVVEGEDAGYFVDAPVVVLRLVCLPGIYRDEVATEPVTFSEPVGELEIPNVGGQLLAPARLEITDLAGECRGFAEVGWEQRHYDPDDPSDLLLDSDELVVAGMTGTQVSRGGAYDPNGSGNNAIRASALMPSYQAICATGPQPHIGSFRVVAGIFPASTNIRLRLSYRIGDGPWHALAAAVPPLALWPQEVDLGTITIEPAPLGDQVWEGRIEALSSTFGEDLDIDYLRLVPVSAGYAKARAPIEVPSVTTQITAYDDFAGGTLLSNLAGRAATSGQSWAAGAAGSSTGEDGDGADFLAGTNEYNRVALADSSLTNGRYVVLGSTPIAETHVQADVGIPAFESLTSGLEIRTGVLARFIDTDNWLMAVRRHYIAIESWTDPWFQHRVSLLKRVAGVGTLIGDVYLGPGHPTGLHTLKLSVDVAGNVSVATALASGELGAPQIVVAGDADLAAGGALDDGLYGLYDATNLASGTYGRRVKNFLVSSPVASEVHTDAVIHPDRKAQLTALGKDRWIRESEDGDSYGRVPLAAGFRFFLPPAGDEGRVTRVAVATRRLDIETLPCVGLTDQTQIQAFYRPVDLTVPGDPFAEMFAASAFRHRRSYEDSLVSTDQFANTSGLTVDSGSFTTSGNRLYWASGVALGGYPFAVGDDENFRIVSRFKYAPGPGVADIHIGLLKGVVSDLANWTTIAINEAGDVLGIYGGSAHDLGANLPSAGDYIVTIVGDEQSVSFELAKPDRSFALGFRRTRAEVGDIQAILLGINNDTRGTAGHGIGPIGYRGGSLATISPRTNIEGLAYTGSRTAAATGLRVELPPAYDSGGEPAPLFLGAHGYGGSELEAAPNPDGHASARALFKSMLDAGFIVATSNAGGQKFGTRPDALAEALDWCLGHYAISSVILWGISMGGFEAMNAVLKGEVPSADGLVLLEATPDLVGLGERVQAGGGGPSGAADFMAAFGMSSWSELEDAVAEWNPIAAPAEDWRGVPILATNSPDDTSALLTEMQALQAKLSGHSFTLYEGTGEHNDPSMFPTTVPLWALPLVS